MIRFKAFISYAIGKPEHVAWVRKFTDDLSHQGIYVKLDQYDVSFGDDFVNFMVAGIAECNYFLFIATDESRQVADREVSNAEERGLWFELREARQRTEATGQVLKEICVLLEGQPPRHYQGRRYADFRDPSRYETALHELAIEMKFGRKKPQPKEHQVLWTCGAIAIPDIKPELTFIGERALRLEQLRSTFEDQQTELPESLRQAHAAYIAQKKQEARGRFTFDDNGSYDLRGISVERPQTASGERQNLYTLHARPTRYYHFAFPNLALDLPVLIDGASVKPRELLGVERETLRFDTLADCPCSFHIGTGTVLITKDNKIVVSVRSRRQFIVGGATYHLSAAEGTLRPADEVNGEFSPFWTSVRSLEDELGLRPGVDFHVENLRCLGILLDTLRAQPIILFYLKSDTITAEVVYQKWQTDSADKHENNNLHFLDWNEDTARILLEGRLDVDATLVEIASNHAQSGFLLAALHEFGEGWLQRWQPQKDEE